MTSAPWRRRAGIVLSPDGRAELAREFLNAAKVIALVESEPETPEVVGVVLAVDPQDRVAVFDTADGTIVAGQSLTDLCESVANACSASVMFEDVSVGVEQDLPDDPLDPFDQELDVGSAFVPDRAVVYTRAPMGELGAFARAVEMPVLAAPYLDGHLIVVSDGPALAEVDWPDTLKPALVIEQGAAYPAVATIGAQASHVHTWDADIARVPSGPKVGDAVAAFCDTTLGTGALVSELMSMLPSVEPTAVRNAIESDGGGPARLIEALGLPEALVGYLGHGDELPALDQARVVNPDGLTKVFARAVTDAQSQMTESVRETTEQMRERADAARVRAESAFDAAETFAEEVVVPIRQSWWTPGVATVELGLGVLAIRRASRGIRAGGKSTTGARLLGVAGAALLVDAVVNAVIFLAPRIKRDL
ncbi:MAG: hypothetical protein ACK5KU_09160 [Beutenbergiaceae bacterium]